MEEETPWREYVLCAFMDRYNGINDKIGKRLEMRMDEIKSVLNYMTNEIGNMKDLEFLDINTIVKSYGERRMVIQDRINEIKKIFDEKTIKMGIIIKKLNDCKAKRKEIMEYNNNINERVRQLIDYKMNLVASLYQLKWDTNSLKNYQEQIKNKNVKQEGKLSLIKDNFMEIRNLLNIENKVWNDERERTQKQRKTITGRQIFYRSLLEMKFSFDNNLKIVILDRKYKLSFYLTSIHVKISSIFSSLESRKKELYDINNSNQGLKEIISIENQKTVSLLQNCNRIIEFFQFHENMKEQLDSAMNQLSSIAKENQKMKDAINANQTKNVKKLRSFFN